MFKHLLNIGRWKPVLKQLLNAGRYRAQSCRWVAGVIITHTDNFLHTTTRMLASSELREHVEIYSFQKGLLTNICCFATQRKGLILHSEYTKMTVFLLKTKQCKSFWRAGTQRIKVPMLFGHICFFADLKIGSRIFPGAFQMNFQPSWSCQLVIESLWT